MKMSIHKYIYFLNNRYCSLANDFDAFPQAKIDTTQKIVILPDDEFDEVVRADLHMIKQTWVVIEKGD
jgi:uncharacterized protein YfeS